MQWHAMQNVDLLLLLTLLNMLYAVGNVFFQTFSVFEDFGFIHVDYVSIC